MIRREPAETGGTYYRIVPEGTVEGYDGFTLRVKKPVQGLDLNRNFPASWRQEFEQLGSGPYPVSEPEIRAVATLRGRFSYSRAKSARLLGRRPRRALKIFRRRSRPIRPRQYQG